MTTIITQSKKTYLPLITDNERAELEDSKKYRPWIIARYSHWTIYLHDADQGLPGRMRVWLKRHVDCMGVDDLDKDELHEFHYEIYPAILQSLQMLGPCERLNHEWLGNETHLHRGHGHYHVTPRYRASLRIGNRIFVDEDCGARRKTPKLELPVEESRHILKLIRGTDSFKHLPH